MFILHVDIDAYIIYRPKRKRTNLSTIKTEQTQDNNDNDNSFIPISKQLDKKIKKSSHVSEETIVANTEAPAIAHSVLPHSVAYNQTRRHSNIEDIQPTTTTNEDLEYLRTPKRNKYMHREIASISRENQETPQRISPNMKTPTTKKKRSDKEEMDASDDDDEENGNEDVIMVEQHDNNDNQLNDSKIGEPPAWLTKLTDKAIETNKQRDFERKKKLLDGDGKHSSGPLQQDVIDLKLIIAHRVNMVKTSAEPIDRMFANLSVTEKMQLKILRSLVLLLIY